MLEKKPNVAIFTSAARGLAHYVVHLYPEIKKYCNPYYVTYRDQKIDDLVSDEISRIYQIVQNQSATSVLETIRFLKDKKIDLINLQVSDTVRKMHMQYFSILSYAKYLGIPVVLTIHDVLTIESMYIDPAAVEMLYALGDSFVVGNDNEKDKLNFYFNKDENNIVAVPHGPYTLFDKNKYTSAIAKKELGLSGKNVILFFGQIRPNKGLKYLIKSLPLVLKEHPNTILYISTDLHLSTPELNEYLKRIEKSGIIQNVKLVKDYIPSRDIEKVFKAADIVALPYTQVSQSGILNLAFAFKKPVVVSDVFSEANTINGQMGYTFPSGKYKELAFSINKILSLKDKGANLGLAGYHHATQKSNWDNAARLTFEAYKLAFNKVGEKSNKLTMNKDVL